ncbi:diguanylate cyclase [Alteromonas sp. C1M14]|uniref:diguanylate cyclase n=1 Tax=Alteromonas sp. C1M14 TaxID=2841567 RepID=UPI001C087CFF|nr:diguanylate cyclase [Alteromonas sp. C1M14]MBU2979430.1 diguanylate cyclase [Alteromonas sp. C1M14]
MRSQLVGSLLFFCSVMPLVVHGQEQTKQANEITGLLERIRSAYNAGQLSVAESLAVSLLKENAPETEPLKNAAIQYELGKIARLQSKYKLANTFFANAEDTFKAHEKFNMVAKAMAERGQINYLQSQYAQALTLFNEAKTLFTEQGDAHGVALQQLNIGVLLHAEGQFDKSLLALQDALTVFNNRNDNEKIARTLSEIGSVYLDLEKFDEAKTYLEDALRINKELGRTYEMARTHSVLGELYLKMGNHNAAEDNLLAAFSAFSAMNAPLDLESAQASLGRVKIAKGEYATGLKYLSNALEEARAQGYSSLATQIHLALSDAFLQLKDTERALKHSNWAFYQAERHGELNAQILAQEKTIQAYTVREDYQHAFEALNVKTALEAKQLDVNQSVILAKANAQIEMQRQAQAFEIQEKNRSVELANVREQNLQNMLALGSLVSLLLFIFLLWSRYNQYLQNRRLAREVKNRTNELEQKNQQLEEAFHALEQVSMRDPLTGLYNRNFLNAQLPGEIQRVQHHYASKTDDTNIPNSDLICFLIDIDYFKRINDEHGHLAGDRFLTQFTDILKEVFRQTDLLIRWGGEEFLAVCRNANREDSVELADRLLTAVKNHTFSLPDDTQIKATCSIGFCALPLCRRKPFDLDWPKTFAVMDYCLYAAKLSQRDCWVGAVEACADKPPKAYPNKLESKFGLSETMLKTSLTNFASIEWPAD